MVHRYRVQFPGNPTFNALVALSRRQLLIAGGLGAVTGVASCSSGSRSVRPAPARTTAPVPGVDEAAFSLGVASGDPLPDSVILWTRLAPDPMNGGGMPQRPVDVEWQVAADERFTKISASGSTQAVPALAHSVHVDAQGLQPATGYFYRFRGGQRDQSGGSHPHRAQGLRGTRTAPSRRGELSELRVRLLARLSAPVRRIARSRAACRRLHLRIRTPARRRASTQRGVRSRTRPLRHARRLPQSLRPVQERPGIARSPRRFPLGAHLG